MEEEAVDDLATATRALPHLHVAVAVVAIVVGHGTVVVIVVDGLSKRQLGCGGAGQFGTVVHHCLCTGVWRGLTDSW
jgi:hypothetical protein